MKPFIVRARILVPSILICITSSIHVQANDGIEVAGDVLAYLLPATAGGLTLGYKDGKGTLQFAESTALALGSTLALKYTIRERRPNHDDHYSFPSAHSSVSFSSAEFLRMRYGCEYGIPGYAVATFVAFSRVRAKQHYLHDVIAGAAIGIVSSCLFTQPYKGWHVQPDIDTKSYGLRLSGSW
jgi:membrane-associated phospholipid phosphatase